MKNSIANKEALEDAWGRLRKTDNSHGVSGLTINQFKENREDNLLAIYKSLKAETFTFSKTRASFIQKKDGDPRPLQIPEIKDRIVLKAIAMDLEERFKHILEPNRRVSFAYQKKSSVKDAIAAGINFYNQGFTTVLETDISDFFGSISLDKLLDEKVFPRLDCKYTKDLILKGLTQETHVASNLPSTVKNRFKSITPGKGIPQGNSLSPLLSNIYLAEFDQYAIEKGYNLIRYSDDLLIFTDSVENANDIKEDIREFLDKKLSLQLKESKTSIQKPSEKPIEFLSIVFDGKQIKPSLSAVNNFRNRIEEHLDLCRAKKTTIYDFIKSIKLTHEGWVSVFSYTLIEPYFKTIDVLVNRALYLGFNSLGWNLVRKNLDDIPKEFDIRGGGSRKMINKQQRTNSGIKHTKDLVITKRKANPLLINKP